MILQQSDIVALEAARPDPFAKQTSTYEFIAESSAQWPDAPALTFFTSVETFRTPKVWTYRQLLGEITRTANLFRRLGVGYGEVIAWRCHENMARSGLADRMADDNDLVCAPPVSACDHPPRGLVVCSLHAQFW